MVTCTSGEGAFIDYAIASSQCDKLINLFKTKHDTPFKPHFALEMTIGAEAKEANYWSLPVPARFDHPRSRGKETDPIGKRTMKRQPQGDKAKIEAEHLKQAERKQSEANKVDKETARRQAKGPPIKPRLDLDDHLGQ